MSKIVNNMTPLGFVDKSRKKRYYINQNTKEIYVAEEPTQKSISIICDNCFSYFSFFLG